ncbi:MAG: ATP-binding protein [Clostridia bacterium]|nr:ATP-binding protein [Clostridia bacterium]
MPYTKELYEKAIEIINQRRLDAEKKQASKLRLFEKMEPEYKTFKKEMIDSVKDALRSIEMSKEDAKEFVNIQKMRNLAAQDSLRLLLEKRVLEPDYLEIKYFCPLCEDTGFRESKLCECHIELLKTMAFEEAGKKSPLKFSKFEDFKLTYYPEKAEGNEGISPREKMRSVYNFCKEYALSFDTDSCSVFMHGETGLGKTHLSLAIAGEVISKGYNVLYNSAQNIFSELQKEHFGKNNNGAYEAMVLECDLLIIDDLGAEFATSFTNAALYNIINTRINTGLPTIISSNLDFAGIEKEYSKRVSSRIIGEYEHLFFVGKDIRQAKNYD